MTCITMQARKQNDSEPTDAHRIQRFRCPACNATFTEPRQRPLGRHYISYRKGR